MPCAPLTAAIQACADIGTCLTLDFYVLYVLCLKVAYVMSEFIGTADAYTVRSASGSSHTKAHIASLQSLPIMSFRVAFAILTPSSIVLDENLAEQKSVPGYNSK